MRIISTAAALLFLLAPASVALAQTATSPDTGTKAQDSMRPSKGAQTKQKMHRKSARHKKPLHYKAAIRHKAKPRKAVLRKPATHPTRKAGASKQMKTGTTY